MAYIISFILLSLPLCLADASSYRANAICANDQLMRWYNSNRGLWLNNNGGQYWWQSANMMSVFNDLALRDSNARNVYNGVWESTYRNAPSHNTNAFTEQTSDGQLIKVYDILSPGEVTTSEAGFLNHFYDDEGWWALAWIGALDNTGNKKYLDEAIAIWSDMHAAWNRFPCGGLPWNKDSNSPIVAIANELYIQVGAALANRVGSDQKATYLNAAKDAWNWFKKSGMINSNHLINDGINTNTCKNNGEPTYTYNQGVILGGLVELYRATGDGSYLDSAATIANAVTASNSPLLNSGILSDSCDRSKSCGGDGIQFKGVFPRNLQRLQAVRPSAQWKSFLETNAKSIWNHDLAIRNGGCFLGIYWAGPSGNEDASSQSSAMDCIIGALSATS